MTRNYTVTFRAYTDDHRFDKTEVVTVDAESYEDALAAGFRAMATNTDFPLWSTRYINIIWNKKNTKKKIPSGRNYYRTDLMEMGWL